MKMDEKLIELVRSFPVLYDLSHKKYMNTGFKNNIWNNVIGRELKVQGSACKSRWYNIRDNYRKSLRKAIIHSGQSSKTQKLYKYADSLEFLKTYMDVRDKGATEFHLKETEELADYGGPDDEQPNQIKDEEARAVANTESEPTQSFANQRAKRRLQQITIQEQMTPQQSESPELMDYVILNKLEKSDALSSKSIHPVDAFLVGIGATLKTLNPYFLNLAKTEIFNIVQKYELKMITSDNYISYDKHQGYSSRAFNVNQHRNLCSPGNMSQISEQSSKASPDPGIAKEEIIIDDSSFLVMPPSN